MRTTDFADSSTLIHMSNLILAKLNTPKEVIKFSNILNLGLGKCSECRSIFR